MSISTELGEVREIALPQGTIRYRERGSGPPVVFVHGLLVNGDLWRKVVPPVAAAGHRCITPDLPLGSHELPLVRRADTSPPGLANLIADLLDALGLDDVTLVGNDTGGALSQILVTRRPERIGRLVLTPCDAFDNFLPKAFRALQLVGGYVPGALLAIGQTTRPRFAQTTPLAFGLLTKRHFPPEIAESYLGPARRSRAVRRDVARILRGIDSRHTLDAALALPRFDRPALIAWASEDRVFPPDHARRLAAIMPDARVTMIDDSYSFVPEDQGERLADLIVEFLREREGAAAPGSAAA